MHRLIRLKLAKALAVLTASTLFIPYAASGALAAAKPVVAPVVSQTVVVFPMDNGSAKASAQMADGLTAVIRGGLAAQPTYHVVAYSDRLPAVDRLVRLDPDKSHMVSGPFYSDKKAIANAIALGKIMSADLVLVGTVERYTVSDKGDGELAASAELFDVETGKSLRTVVVTGHSGKALVTSAALKPGVENEATVDVGEKIVSGIIDKTYSSTPVVASTPAATPKKKHSGATWIGALLLAVAVGVLAGGHSSSGSSSSDGPPPPPGL